MEDEIETIYYNPDADTGEQSASTALAVVDAAPVAPAIQAPHSYSRAQLDLIKATVAQGASDLEFALFVEVCKRSRLDPFTKQIYAIMRNAREEDEKGNWQTVKRMTIQTGIDGYQKLAADTHELGGIDDVIYDTEDGDHPTWARVTVYRLVQGQRMPFTATARWREYCQRDAKSNPTGMWRSNKMPWRMLGKCAIALALRMAFPAELSGIYTAEEMQQADNEYIPTPATGAPAPQAAAPAKPTPTKPTPKPAPAAKAVTPAQPADTRVDQALGHQTVIGLLSDLEITDIQKQREHLTKALQDLDKAKGRKATGRELMDALEDEIAKKQPSDTPAEPYDLRQLPAGPMPN